MADANLAEALRRLRDESKGPGVAKAKQLSRVESLVQWLTLRGANRRRIREKYGARVELDDLLFLLFLGMKLGGALRWSWWLVFVPYWGGIAAIAAALVGAAILDGIAPREGAAK